MKKIVTSLLLLCLGSYACAQVPGSTDSVKVSIVPDHSDWLYRIGEKVTCKLSIRRLGKPLTNIKVYYEIGPEKMAATRTQTVEMKDTVLTIDCGTLNVAGFLRCKAAVAINGKRYTGLATLGFEPMSIKATAKLPDDFMQFWTNARAEALKIPLDPKMQLLPERSTDKVNVYHISFQNYKLGSRIFGILCVPKKEGKYPAVLKVPGAGVRGYKGDVWLAERGLITLEIGIHGIPVTLPDSVYTSLAATALNAYPSYNNTDKNSFYYKRVYLGCVRALDFIATLPQYDGKNLATSGGSQGGALAIVTAALDARVKCLAAFYPALSDMSGYLYNRAGGWPHLFYQTTLAQVDQNKLITSGYYDVVNFARQLKVPGIYSWGYNDETCPPTSTFSAYNVISAPKEFYPYPDTGHWTYPAQWALVNTWLLKKLKDD
jgi:cephalosporin-C deacetylase